MARIPRLRNHEKHESSAAVHRFPRFMPTPASPLRNSKSAFIRVIRGPFFPMFPSA
jgi:hypothetical protein